jgi:hypothetical protein
MRQEHRKNLILTGLSLLSLSIPLQAAKDLVEYSPFLPPGYAEKLKEIQDKKDQKIESKTSTDLQRLFSTRGSLEVFHF